MKIKVGLVDSGIDCKHPKLKDKVNVQKSKSFIDDTITDFYSHGTAVGGLILFENVSNSKTLNENVEIICCKVTNNAKISVTSFINALKYCIQLKVDIINLSLSIDKSKLFNNEIVEIKRLIQEAYNNNIIIVASSGNNREKKNIFTELQQELILVTAINLYGDYTNYSKELESGFKFFGGEISQESEGSLDELVLSTYPTNLPENLFNQFGISENFSLYHGTSMATAKCTNRILRLIRNESLEQIKNILKLEGH